jgi:UDP-glucose 4-epimerase
MVVAVVGASGFLGRSLVAAFDRLEVPVQAYTRSVPFLAPDGRPDVGLTSARTVYWLATLINPQTAEQEPARIRADRTAFEGFLSALRRLERPPTVVLVSSGGTVYDPATPPPYAESAPCRPSSAYGRAKLDLERVLAERAPGPHVTLRVSNAYGPGQLAASGQGVVAHWLRAAALGQDIRVFGDPGTTRDYVYVDDVADALAAVAASERPLPPVINVGSGRPTTLAELADTVLDVAGAPGVRVVVGERRSFDVPRTWLDVSLAAQELGWQPRTSLREGVAAAWLDALARQ